MHESPPDDPFQWFLDLSRKHIITQTIDPGFYDTKPVEWDILRTDLIHPICSGNKFFKLKYYLLDALQKKYTRISTAGGFWSNHLVASAFAAHACGLGSTGYVRGLKQQPLSQTLKDASEWEMDLQFIQRTAFQQFTSTETVYHIPAGGYGILGAKGAGEILSFARHINYTHILCATGTGTMLAGLTAAAPQSMVMGMAVLKHPELGREAGELIGSLTCHVQHDYHFGGYARKDERLLAFMNNFYTATRIPTDFVYTGKLMYGIHDLLKKDFFPAGSRILAIHSGGLQGNRSLKKGELVF